MGSNLTPSHRYCNRKGFRSIVMQKIFEKADVCDGNQYMLGPISIWDIADIYDETLRLGHLSMLKVMRN